MIFKRFLAVLLFPSMLLASPLPVTLAAVPDQPAVVMVEPDSHTVSTLIVYNANLLAQEEGGEEEPAPGTDVDLFLLLAQPLIILVAAAIIKAAEWLFPDTLLDSVFISRLVRGVFAIIFLIAWVVGATDQLNTGVQWLNDISVPLLQVLGLLGVWVGPSALTTYAVVHDIPFLGARQGSRAASFAA